MSAVVVCSVNKAYETQNKIWYREITKEDIIRVSFLSFIALLAITHSTRLLTEQYKYSLIGNIRKALETESRVHRILDGLNVAVIEIEQDQSKITYANKLGFDLLQ